MHSQSRSFRFAGAACSLDSALQAEYHQHDKARTTRRSCPWKASCRCSLPIVLYRVLLRGRLWRKQHVRSLLPIPLYSLLTVSLRNPNLFSKQVVQNLYDISGAYPIFRIGGSTQNSAVYYPNQTEAIIDPFDSVASDQPSYSMIGPAFMQSFQQFPKGTQYIYGKIKPEAHIRIMKL
jgi:hypothetical protein